MTVRTPLASLTLRFSSLLLVAGLATASAHEVWIEDTPEGKLFVRLAEFGDDLEKSPGHLDALGVPVAFAVSKEGKPATLNAKKESDGYVLIDAASQSSAFVEAPFAVLGNGDKPGRKPIFYARWHVGNEAAKPALTFDIVPSGKPGVARVFLRGQPLAEAKVTAFLPDGGEEELTSDKDGTIRLKAQKPGFYLLVSKHQREPQSGFHRGLAYEAVSHNCSLAWRQPQGAGISGRKKVQAGASGPQHFPYGSSQANRWPRIHAATGSTFYHSRFGFSDTPDDSPKKRPRGMA